MIENAHDHRIDHTELLTFRQFGINHLRYRARVMAQQPSISGGVLLINDTRTQNNVGCRATSNALINYMAAGGLNVAASVTLAEIQALSNEVPFIPGKLDEMVAQVLAHAAFQEFLAAAIRKADAIIINGEGSFYDQQKKGIFTAILGIIAKRHFAKRVAVVNTSVSFTDPEMGLYCDALFGEADVIAFREHASFESALGRWPSRSPIFAPDAAFQYAMKPLPQRQARMIEGIYPNELLAGPIPLGAVLISGTSAIFRKDRPAFTGYHALRQLVVDLIGDGHPVVLFAADQADERLLSSLATDLSLPMISASTGTDALLNYLSSASCLLSGRFHASILAACVGTPLILGEANFPKTQALRAMLKVDTPFFSFHRFQEQRQEILAAINAIRDGGDALRARYRAEAESLAEASSAWVPRLVAVLGSP
ncbi:polysaccharide pyruvyl transferase family protein [Sphingobium sp. Z007]|uniref:polysaccharide pyruvyl transferase family protein n=1 Tax=Sphingobium sp. Z007 TaxID=627495 RepID=UPI000B49FA8C|nr:polysaccharide pyruvyl transferase family protein [Sphingobium sp. Z007]